MTEPKVFEQFFLKGQMPSGKNSVIVTRTGHRFPAKRFVDWREDAMAQLKHQRIDSTAPFEGPCTVEVGYARGDLRRRDVPGMIDALCHLLEKYGIVKDDSQLIEWHWLPAEFDDPGIRVNIIAREEAPVCRLPKRQPKPRSRSR